MVKRQDGNSRNRERKKRNQDSISPGDALASA